MLVLLLVGQVFLLGASWLQAGSPAAGEGGESGETATTGRRASRPAGGRVASATGEVRSAPRPAEVTLLGITRETEGGVARIVLDLSAPVTVSAINTSTPRFVRFRVQPGLGPMSLAVQQQLRRHFERFSCFRSRWFSEFLIYGDGAVGRPHTRTSPTGLPQLVIPFAVGEGTEFPLRDGRELRRGLWYYRDRVATGRGAADVHLLRCDLHEPDLVLVPVQAHEGICAREPLTSMGRRYQAIAGINAAYFDPATGDPIGTLIVQRRLISSPVFGRSVFGLTREGRPLFGNPDFEGEVRASGVELAIDGVNQPRRGSQVVVFTSEYARSTGTKEDGCEFILIQGRVVGMVARDAKIPPDGVVLSAGGKAARRLAHLRLGDRVELSYRVSPPWDRVQHAICGGPRLIREGQVDINGREERFDASIVYGRHPRSALAVTDWGDLLMVVVDGRSARNSGMTLAELAAYLQHLGARQAINLDGGGSSGLLVRGRLVNEPSDRRERPISNGLLVVTP